MIVEIARASADFLLKQAAEAYPAECCGLLLGQVGRIEAAVPAANVAADPLLRFEIDPATLLRIHREAREAGKTLLGWYHSHPNGTPEPSMHDAAQAEEDGRLWLIVAGQAVHGFVTVAEGVLHGRFAPVELVPIP